MPETVEGRKIPLAAIRDAARAIYGAAIRTPLVRVYLEPPAPELYLKLEVLQPIGSFKIRGAYNAVRQLSREQLRDGVWTVSAGNAAQGVAFAARKVGARCSVMVMDTAPDTKIRAIERLGASIVWATYDECWRTVESHAFRSHERPFRPPIRRRSVHRRKWHRGSGDSRGPARRRMRSSRRSAAAACSRASRAVMRELRPETRVFAAEPETAAPLAASLAAGRPVYFDNWRASFVDGAGGKSVLPTMWPLLSALSGSIVVTARRRGARDEARRRARSHHRRRRRRLRDRRGPERAVQARGKSSRSFPAATSIFDSSRRLSALVDDRSISHRQSSMQMNRIPACLPSDRISPTR